jgi:GNAT superfamily N-acetyltransferase
MPDPEQLVTVRLATMDDVPALGELIALSVRTLQTAQYSKEQIEGSLAGTQGVDTHLIEDGTYYVAVTRGGSDEERLVGCGGWSKRKTLFGSDSRKDRQDELLDPAKDAAKIRAFFVHPDWTRRGIGTKILRISEEAAQAEGFHRLEMGATLAGVPLYAARGYSQDEAIEVPLPNGHSLTVVKMSKKIEK